MNSKEAESKPSHMSTACGVEISTVFFLLMGRKRVLERMVTVATEKGFSPEIFLFSGMMKREKLAELKQSLKEKGISSPYAFHFPNYCGWKVENFPIACQCLFNKDLSGALFYLPTRLLVSPVSIGHFCDLIGNFTAVFSPEECLVLTVHDHTIIEEKGDNLVLNKAGEKLSNLASEGYPIGIELVFEKDFPPASCPYIGYTERFLSFCKTHKFGLTVDLCTYAALVGENGLPLEGLPPFLIKFVTLAEEFNVPIRMVHFNPFNLWNSCAHLAPCDSVYSFSWIKEFLKKLHLGGVPISLEITSNNLRKLDECGFIVTSPQWQIEKILSQCAIFD